MPSEFGALFDGATVFGAFALISIHVHLALGWKRVRVTLGKLVKGHSGEAGAHRALALELAAEVRAA